MAKPKVTYVCSNCKKVSGIQYGICSNCGATNSFERVTAVTNHGGSVARDAVVKRVPKPINEINSIEEKILTGIGEFDRVMGGGLTIGGIVLLGGSPGAGKSTLVLSVANQLSLFNNVLYVSGEESENQIAQRARRLGIDSSNIYIIYDNVVDNIINDYLPSIKPTLLIIDSITTMVSASVENAKGSPTQVGASASRIIDYAKSHGLCVIMISHVTKDGLISGANHLMHDVDTVVYLDGDVYNVFRLLRSVKNRFGAIGEVGVFEMDSDGMREVHDASRAFISDRMSGAVGSAITVIVEGQRPLLIEVQALVTPSGGGPGARRATGISRDRTNVVIDSLSRHSDPPMDFSVKTIHALVVGGLDVSEPACDLATALAIVSSDRDIPIGMDWVAIGEVLLTGQVKSVQQMDRRVREAATLGFTKIIVPESTQKINPIAGVMIYPVRKIQDAIDLVFN